MNKVRIVIWSIFATLATAVLAAAAFFYDRRRVVQSEREMLAQRLRNKVETLKRAEVEQAAAVAVEVSKVEEQTKQEVARDSVDAANDLIASLRDGSGR